MNFLRDDTRGPSRLQDLTLYRILRAEEGTKSDVFQRNVDSYSKEMMLNV